MTQVHDTLREHEAHLLQTISWMYESVGRDARQKRNVSGMAVIGRRLALLLKTA